MLVYQDWEGSEAKGEAAFGEGWEGGGVAITFVDDEKFIKLRLGEDRVSHKRGRMALKELGAGAGEGLLFDIPPNPALPELAYMGRPRENPMPAIGDEISLGWVEG